jgi:hypothetical protein
MIDVFEADWALSAGSKKQEEDTGHEQDKAAKGNGKDKPKDQKDDKAERSEKDKKVAATA